MTTAPDPSAAPAGRPGRVRRRRSTTESLGSIVISFEVVIVFLAALVVFGLGRLPAALALGGGGALLLLMIVTVPLLRYPVGVWLGWIAQAVFFAAGFLVSEIFFVAAIFIGIWTYCMVMGGRLDRARRAAEAAEPDPSSL
ncbi:DUF4233 domain-containing protein [Naasia lichenicola]|uniref:DUF4233 domain-containing protein n=1 Tax=Naasia lichenicola TaxID=2565933 RepID=UPI001E39D7E0|nr:DUF4233 domain-containing protein [Naasia lichenicola]